VSLEAAERLLEASQEHQRTQQDMLTWMLLKGLPKYSSHNDDITGLKPYKWPEQLMNPDGAEIKYKGTTGSKQLNLAISSTAYNKLECHKTATKYSKARIVQALLLNYRFLTEAQHEANRQSQERNRLYKNEDYMHKLFEENQAKAMEALTPEQIQSNREAIDRIFGRGLLSQNDEDTNE